MMQVTPGWATATHFSTVYGAKVHRVRYMTEPKPRTRRTLAGVRYLLSPCGQYTVAKFAKNIHGPTTCSFCKRWEKRTGR